MLSNFTYVPTSRRYARNRLPKYYTQSHVRSFRHRQLERVNVTRNRNKSHFFSFLFFNRNVILVRHFARWFEWWKRRLRECRFIRWVVSKLGVISSIRQVTPQSIGRRVGLLLWEKNSQISNTRGASRRINYFFFSFFYFTEYVGSYHPHIQLEDQREFEQLSRARRRLLR